MLFDIFYVSIFAYVESVNTAVSRSTVSAVVDAATWDEIYDQFSGIENATLRSVETFPNGQNGRGAYATTTTQTQYPGSPVQNGNRDPIRQEAVR